MMSDSTWDEYLADDVTAVANDPALPPVAAPAVDAAATDAWQGDLAASWSDWNADIADDARADANAEVEYAMDAYAGGFEGAGDAAMARAELQYGNAADASSTAADYAGEAAGEYGSAAANLDAAADAVTYDTSSTSSYDTSGYDASAAVVDTSSSYDTSSSTTE
jgi:hypothetical protein